MLVAVLEASDVKFVLITGTDALFLVADYAESVGKKGRKKGKTVVTL